MMRPRPSRGARGCFDRLQQTIAGYQNSYLLRLSGWGDADMIHVFDEAGEPIGRPNPSRKIGADASAYAEAIGANHVIPFSSFHRYQRRDSAWANQYRPTAEKYREGFRENRAEFLEPFCFVDCGNGEVSRLEAPNSSGALRAPEEFGDNASDPLDESDWRLVEGYFKRKALVQRDFRFLTFAVGGQEHTVSLNPARRAGIRFESPRQSLVDAVRDEVFDNLLLSNFTKATLYGATSLYAPNFTYAVASLARVSLAAESLDRSVLFYRDTLGMRVLPGAVGGSTASARLRHPTAPGYDGQASLELREQSRNRAPDENDVYWKIGVTLPDVDHATGWLRDRGVSVSDPAQFLDVGYLCHLTDPDGYPIELLQHRLAENHRSGPPDDTFPLGGRATLGQITLRVDDAQEALRFYRDRLGMTLLSQQVIEPYRFTLYFLAFTTENPPDADIDAIGNREWLWQRPYTTLELQHRWDRPAAGRVHDSGFLGIGLNGARSGSTLLGPSGVPIALDPVDSGAGDG